MFIVHTVNAESRTIERSVLYRSDFGLDCFMYKGGHKNDLIYIKWSMLAKTSEIRTFQTFYSDFGRFRSFEL